MIRIYWNWKYWGFYRVVRFNGGYPYTQYKLGPLDIRKYWS